MQLPSFLHISPQSTIKGAGIIMCTTEPYLYANILQLKTNQETTAKLAQYQPYAAKQVPGYNMLLIFGGTMQKAHLRTEEINNILVAMTQYFATEKINPNAGYYKRYLTT